MSKRSLRILLDEDEADLHGEAPTRPYTRARLSSTPQVTQEAPLSLSYTDISHPAKQTPFQQPTQIISFSYTPSRVLEFTDSALRYFVDPPLGAKLGHAYERWVKRPEERGRIDGLVKAFSKARSGDAAASLQDVEVVSWRGVMTKILTSPYEEREGWELNVMLVDETMYFEEHLSEARLKEKEALEPRHRLQSYYGYAFESYCTSNTPTHNAMPPNSGNPSGWGGDVDTNVQWCSVVRTKLGNTRLLIGGEVDCVRGKYTGKTDTFVELKTSLTIRGPHDEAKFEKKLLKFYFQSFLLGVPEILVGFRTPSGIVTTTQSFKTIHIPRLVRGKPGAWDPLVCLEWGHRFLTFLKDAIQKDAEPSEKRAPVWRVKFVPGTGVSVVKLDHISIEEVMGNEERVGFLPTWYWDELQTGSTHMDSRLRNEEDRGTRPPSDALLANAGWQI